ncbi:MAG: S41 family peptidase [Thermoleophilia bacterium]|nr:S41 family peptidase [Thermoleophilia bacterium]
MRRYTKTIAVLVASVVAAVLLLGGGFLLGAHPQVGGPLQDLFREGDETTTSTTYASDYKLMQEVLDKLRATYYKPIDPSALEGPAIDGLLAGLGDPYTVYMDPEEYKAFLEDASGTYSGVGMVVEMQHHLVTIVSIFKDSPAERAGIRPGDIVVSVDEVPTDGMSLDEVVSRIKGPEGTKVTLGIYRVEQVSTTSDQSDSDEEGAEEDEEGEGAKADSSYLPLGGKLLTFTLVRKRIEIPVTEMETRQVDGQKVAIIRFFTFSEGSAGRLRQEVLRALNEEHAQAIILDLRNNGGGLLDQAVGVASMFLPKDVVVVSTEGLHSPKHVYQSEGGPVTAAPMVVLVNRYTASASEIVSGALQDHKRATIVGETTFGKGLVQSIEALSNGGAIKVTTAVYYTPAGRDINETGIVPDVQAVDDPGTPDVDEAVEKALTVIVGEASN